MKQILLAFVTETLTPALRNLYAKYPIPVGIGVVAASLLLVFLGTS